MKYVISEEELKDFIKNPLAYKFVDDFLKSKSPVEEVQEITFALDDGVLKNKTLKMYIEVSK